LLVEEDVSATVIPMGVIPRHAGVEFESADHLQHVPIQKQALEVPALALICRWGSFGLVVFTALSNSSIPWEVDGVPIANRDVDSQGRGHGEFRRGQDNH